MFFNTAAATPVVCDAFTALTDFSVARYAGQWYEQMHVVDPQEPSYYQCSTAAYTNLTDDETDPTIKHFDVYNSFQSKVLGIWTPRIGVHPKAYCGTDGACYITFFGKTVTTPNLNVVETDYENYAINYWCDTDTNLVRVWIDTREAVVSDEYFNSLYAKVLDLFPNFDETTFVPRLTQGDMCSYASVDKSVADFLADYKLF